MSLCSFLWCQIGILQIQTLSISSIDFHYIINLLLVGKADEPGTQACFCAVVLRKNVINYVKTSNLYIELGDF